MTISNVAFEICWEHEIGLYALLLNGASPGVVVARRPRHFVTDEKPRIERDESLMANKHGRSSELDQTSLPGRQC
jgi:hypothetical protein